MPNAYETWRETKRLLEDESVTDDQDAYYQAVLDSLQPKALHAYLTEFVASNFNYTDEVADIEAGDIPKFLAGLDELRTPNTKAARQLFFNPAIGQVSRLREMNWTGDNTYGEAIDDVIQVLLAVWDGKPFPKLERFRCPSRHLLSDSKGNLTNEVRCDHQLPHGEKHVHQINQHKHVTWTDEQSVNPPKSYDEFARCTSRWNAHRCGLAEGHEGRHGDAGLVPTGEAASWSTRAQNTRNPNPDPINRPLTSSRCGASIYYSAADKSVTLYCKFKEGHNGKHEAPTGETFGYTERGA